jgi:hypothetical protein
VQEKFPEPTGGCIPLFNSIIVDPGKDRLSDPQAQRYSPYENEKRLN